MCESIFNLYDSLRIWSKEFMEKVVMQTTIDDQILFTLYACVALLILVNYVLHTKYRDRSKEMGPLLKFLTEIDRLRLGLGCIFGIYVVTGICCRILGKYRGLSMVFGYAIMNLAYDSLVLKDLSGFSFWSLLKQLASMVKVRLSP